MVTEFDTGRLTLRLMSEVDETLFCDLYADPETMRFIGPPLTRERAARGLRGILRRMRRESPEQIFCQVAGGVSDQVFFTLIDNGTAAAIGISSLQHIDPAGRRAEAGIMIHANFRSRGFAKEGLSAVMQLAFAHLPVDEVWVRIAVDHTVVEKLVISVGLQRGAVSAADDGESVMRIWSAHRNSWPLAVSG